MDGGSTPTNITLTYMNIIQQQVTANQPVTITTNVINRGDRTSNYDVVLKINGRVEQTETVSVSPNAAHPVTFTVTKSQPGTYTVAIGNQQGSFTVIGEGSTTTSSNGTSGALPTGALFAFILAGIVFVVGTLVILSRRTNW